MKRPFTFVLGAVLCAGIHAFQWPVERRVVTATFGEDRGDHFHGGMAIGGGEQPVYPIEDGEIIFVFEEGASADSIPTGLGNFVVVEHDRGLRSLYAHLKPGSIRGDGNRAVKREPLGLIGDTGASHGKLLHFQVVDSEVKRQVNPLLLLPALDDTVTPRVDAYLVDRTGERKPLRSGVRLPAGRAELLVEAFDVSEHVGYFAPMAPFRVSAYLNGSAVADFSFESIQERDGSMLLSGGRPKARDELYRGAWVMSAAVLSLSPGDNVFEVFVGDYVGNESSVRVSVTVTE